MDLSFFNQFRLGYVQTNTEIKDHIYERSRVAFRQGDAARDALRTPEEVRERQEALRSFVIDSFGGLPSGDTPLEAQVTGSIDTEAFTVEKIIYQARPRHYVTASLYLPKNRPTRCPAVLFLCGHSPDGRMQHNYQNVCQMLALSGLIVLAQDPVGQGERFSYHDPATGTQWVPPAVREHDYVGIQCRLTGYHLARYFLHDAMRGVDYLCSRPEVDPERIGVTGSSGGGTQSSLLMMADPRVAAAAPGTFIMNRETYQHAGQAQDAEQIWPGFTQAGFDHEDILLAMAPKPVCVLAVTADFFPIEGARRTVERSKRIWGLFGEGREEAVSIFEDIHTHAYTLPLARAAARFFSRHLLGCEVNPDGFQPVPFSKETLRSTKSGQVSADFPDAEFAFHANRALLTRLEEKRRALPGEERREQALRWLRERVEAYREPYPANPRVIISEKELEGLDTDIAFWWTQPKMANLGMLLRPDRAPAREGKCRGVTIALWDGGTHALGEHLWWLLRECRSEAGGRAVLVLNLSGMGPLTPAPVNAGQLETFYGTFHKLTDDLDWLDDSLVALRTYELTRAPEALATAWPELDVSDIRLYAHGRCGVYARLAAALEPRLGPCRWEESFTWREMAGERFYNSHDAKSLVLPGALQHFDLDEPFLEISPS